MGLFALVFRAFIEAGGRNAGRTRREGGHLS